MSIEQGFVTLDLRFCLLLLLTASLANLTCLCDGVVEAETELIKLPQLAARTVRGGEARKRFLLHWPPGRLRLCRLRHRRTYTTCWDTTLFSSNEGHSQLVLSRKFSKNADPHIVGIVWPSDSGRFKKSRTVGGNRCESVDRTPHRESMVRRSVLEPRYLQIIREA